MLIEQLIWNLSDIYPEHSCRQSPREDHSFRMVNLVNLTSRSINPSFLRSSRASDPVDDPKAWELVYSGRGLSVLDIEV